MITAGALVPQFLRNDHLTSPSDRVEAPCTHAQMIRYLDSAGQLLVEVFRYLRPDGTLGGSGRPDPKRLRLGSAIPALAIHA